MYLMGVDVSGSLFLLGHPAELRDKGAAPWGQSLQR